MIIEIQHDKISAKSTYLQKNIAVRLRSAQVEGMSIAQDKIPQAGESSDMRQFSNQLTAFFQSDLKNMRQAIEGYAKVLQAIASNYEQAQIEAIKRALLL